MKAGAGDWKCWGKEEAGLLHRVAREHLLCPTQDLPTLGDDVPESQGLNLGHSGGIPGGNVLMLTWKNGGYYAGCDSQEGDF